MLTTTFQDVTLSRLGYGCMRFPTKEDKSIDEEKTFALLKKAMESGINYYDTAWFYHSGKSEEVLGRFLDSYPRESYYLADKLPWSELSERVSPKDVFNLQLDRCGKEFFDFYLLHNVSENTVGVFESEQYQCIPYLLSEKKAGRIRHLGFSCHCEPETLEAFLNRHEGAFEFCQIQLNWLDWSLQRAKEKVRILNEHNIPIWVMEPVRGGRLARLPSSAEAEMKKMRPNDSISSWSFRFLQSIPGITMILSGMTAMDQLEDNLNTFSELSPQSFEELGLLMTSAERLKTQVPCTGCHYCTEHCPIELDIPQLLKSLNEKRYDVESHPAYLEGLSNDKLPSACLGCGSCAEHCPQKIDIPNCMQELSQFC